MKQLISVILFLSLAILGYSQTHHEFEVFSGRAFETEAPKGAGRVYIYGRSVFGGAYRYDLGKGFKAGVKAMYSPTYSHTGGYLFRALTANLTGEYQFRRDKKVSPFLSLGAGPQYVHCRAYYKEGDYNKVEMGILCEAGVDINSKLRFSLGNYGHGEEPFLYLTLGWRFL